MDNELILFDRLEVIKSTIQKYGEDNFYISFSGGKDSTILHHLVDMALPNNKIPRVYSNTGIEYLKIVEFVKKLSEKDDRIIILKPTTNIKKTLEEKGYPFKSKEYSHYLETYQNNIEVCDKYFEQVRENPKLLEDYEWVHNLPKGAKYVLKQFYGLRERERGICTDTHLLVPKVLKYQFNKDFKLKVSKKCCDELKKKPILEYQKQSGRKHKMLGIMVAEGGERALKGKCQAFKNGHLSFHPLIKVSKEWEEWFIETYHIELCELYYPPYNFARTGCKGCPYSLHLEEQLAVMERLLPNEKAQCELIWQPVYKEYRRMNYRLKRNEQIDLFEGD